MTTKARIAVVGAGLIGRKHIALVQKHATLAAVVDPALAAKEFAADLDAPWFDTLAKCLSDTTLDGVIVASPNQMHLDHGSTCLSAGVPVLIEKPLAETTLAARALATLQTETNVPLLVGHHRRHSPIVQAAKSVLDRGQLGRLVAVNGLFWLNKPADYFDVAWRCKEGGGPTWINLIHDIDLLQHFCGPVVQVQAQECRQTRGLEVEDTSAILLGFANGVLGTVSVSDTVSAPWSWELTAGENPAYPKTDQSCYLIAGTKGSLSVPDLRCWSHTGAQSWWAPIESDVIDVVHADPVEEQFLHFLQVIAGQAVPRVTAQDGLRNIEVLEAIKSAALHGATQNVGEGL